MNDEELLVTHVPRALDIRSKLFGFEIPDLLLIFMNLASTNLLFESTQLRYPIVWGTTLSLAAFLFFMKRNKPENYLLHLGEFLINPCYRSAGEADATYRRLQRRKRLDEN